MSTLQFPIFPLRNTSRTSIKRPRHILEFSWDDEHNLHPLNDQSLRYYYPPFFEPPWVQPAPVPLSNGYDDWIKVDESIDYHLDGFLRTLQAHEEKLLSEDVEVGDVRVRAEVVAWRGILTKVMTAPYDLFIDFEFNVTCFQDAIYMELNHEFKSESDRRQESKPHPIGQPSQQDKMQYWGYKFESLATIPRPWGETAQDEIERRDNEVVNNNSQYCSIVRTGIGNTTMLLAGEVDCIMHKPDDMDVDIPWVELKTSAWEPNENPKTLRKWESKMLRFWAQSFLLGVPTIVVGLRTQDGYLRTLRTLDVQKLPQQVKQMQGSWDGNVCVNTVAAFLDFLKANIMGTEGVWRVKMINHGRDQRFIELLRIEETGTGSIVEPGFKAHRERLQALEAAHGNVMATGT